MRGKLRDKRATGKRDVFKREVIERRRTTKRDNRPLIQVEQFDDENYELELDEMEEEKPAPRQKVGTQSRPYRKALITIF